MTRDADTVIRFAEEMLFLLQHGQFQSTYKYAVLLSLPDLALENTRRDGIPPDTFTTVQLADKVIELYWDQTQPYDTHQVLQQSTQRQAIIVREILRSRRETGTLTALRYRLPARYERLRRATERVLIEQPLPKLQRIDGSVHERIYRIAWSDDRTTRNELRQRVSAYQRGDPSQFDNRIVLIEGVTANLVRLNGLLRPLIQHEWARHVAKINGLPEARLE